MHLAGVVVLHLPAAGKLQLLVGEHVEEGDEVTVVLVALEVVSIPSHLADHVLQAGVARKHAVGTLRRRQRRGGVNRVEFKCNIFLCTDCDFLFKGTAII